MKFPYCINYLENKTHKIPALKSIIYENQQKT